MSKAKASKKTKATEDTLVYLNDIRGTAELLEAEIGHIEDRLGLSLMTVKAEELELAIDDVAREVFKQYLRLQEISEGKL
jgi:hypothetical protein